MIREPRLVDGQRERLVLRRGLLLFLALPSCLVCFVKCCVESRLVLERLVLEPFFWQTRQTRESRGSSTSLGLDINELRYSLTKTKL